MYCLNCRALFAIAFLLAISACTVGPDFERPSPPNIDRYVAPHDLTDASEVKIGRVEARPVDSWWKAFGSSQLDSLVEQALTNNHSLAESVATLQKVRHLAIAAGGQRWPQVDLSLQAERQKHGAYAITSSESSVSGSGLDRDISFYSVSGGVSFDPDLFGGARRSIERVSAQERSQFYETEASHLTLAGQTVVQVLIVAALNDRIAMTNILLDDDERTLDATRAKLLAGDGTMTEVLAAEAQLVADQSELPQLIQRFDQARHGLAALLGIAPSELGATDFTLDQFQLSQDIPVTLPSELVRTRPDILQAEAEWHAAVAQAGVATSRLYPSLTLRASVSQSSQTLDGLFINDGLGFDFLASLTAPIFHGGKLKAEKRGALAEARAAAARYEQTLIGAFVQVADLLTALQNDQDSIAGQMKSVEVAARLSRLSQRSFEVGNIGILEVLEAERAYQRARLGLIAAKERRLSNVARLHVATAAGWSRATLASSKRRVDLDEID